MEKSLGTKYVILCSHYNAPIFFEIYKGNLYRTVSLTLSKHILHYGPRWDFPYYNSTENAPLIRHIGTWRAGLCVDPLEPLPMSRIPWNKTNNKTYQSVRTVLKSDAKTIQTDTLNTHMHYRLLSLLGTGKTHGRFKLVV